MVDPASAALVIAGKLASPSLLYRILTKFSNTTATDAEYREILDGLTLAMAARYNWDQFPEDERPTDEDVRNASEDFRKEYAKASGNPKRKILFNAFFGYFNPKFYREGLNKILLGYVVQLEYPEAHLLARLVREHEKQIEVAIVKALHQRQEQILDAAPPPGRDLHRQRSVVRAQQSAIRSEAETAEIQRARDHWMPIVKRSVDNEAAKKLVALKLVQYVEGRSLPVDGHPEPAVTMDHWLANAIVEFCWTEEPDAERGPGDSEPGNQE